jgi:hypothetical protein
MKGKKIIKGPRALASHVVKSIIPEDIEKKNAIKYWNKKFFFISPASIKAINIESTPKINEYIKMEVSISTPIIWDIPERVKGKPLAYEYG